MTYHSRWSKALSIVALVTAGEAIYGLPFHITRYFRPTVLQVFDLSNVELGSAQAAYGVVAMASYFLGGPIADRFSARRLLTASLIATGGGGIYYASIPSLQGLTVLFGFWGLTTILLFWAALIRATREWGTYREQGRAYGFLESGRGLLAALLVSVGAIVFARVLPDNSDVLTDAQRLTSLQTVIRVYALVVFATAGLVWWGVAEVSGRVVSGRSPGQFGQFARERLTVLRLPTVWLHSAIVICAYSCLKGVDDFALFAVEGYGLNELEATKITAITAWVRPVAALGIGFLSDRWYPLYPSRTISLCFITLAVGNLAFATVTPGPSAVGFFFLNAIFTCIALYGLRGVYFALLEEAKVSPKVTGTATGVVSFIGFTPDVFAAPLAGWILDRSPGADGHQQWFLVLAGVAALGLLASVVFSILAKQAANSVLERS